MQSDLNVVERIKFAIGRMKMHTEQELRDDPVLVKALTGLGSEVFWELIKRIEEQYDAYERDRLNHDGRKRAIGGGRKFGQSLIIRIAQLLLYLRLHDPQQTSAKHFGGGQVNVSRDLRRLLPFLCQVLPVPEIWQKIEEGKILTEADILEIEQLVEGQAIVDATEQQVHRPQDSDDRKEHYSGKKKAFTLKSQIVTDADHHILAITEAVPGSEHDKKLSDEVKTVERLPEDSVLYADKGYQGIADQVRLVPAINAATGQEEQVPAVIIDIPIKKPKGKELTQEEKEFNHKLGSIRVRVEHCIGWVKNWKIIATRFRCVHSIYTKVLQVVCGLVNWQTQRWQAAKAVVAA